MKQLLEDYKRRLNTVEVEADRIFKKKGATLDDVDTHKRLMIKASCYRTFISELEKELNGADAQRLDVYDGLMEFANLKDKMSIHRDEFSEASTFVMNKLNN